MTEIADFTAFKNVVREQFEYMTLGTNPVFRVEVTKDDMWNTYMNAFPPGTNEIFRERREHDCVYCKQFINRVGNIVMLTPDLELVTLWDVEAPHPYDVVTKALADLMRAAVIRNVFLHNEKSAGIDSNKADLDGTIVTFEHFYVKIPKALVNTNGIATARGEHRSTFDVLKRGLSELKQHAAETVVELIEQNSLYRGQEFLPQVESFLRVKQQFDEVDEDKRDRFVWFWAGQVPQTVSRIRNSAIGTLLIDLSEDMELDAAVRKYEAVVAPANYKRPTALVTKAMIQRAEKKVEELGFMESLQRRYAVTEDITVNNVLFADRSARKLMQNPFDELADEAGKRNVSAKHLEKVEEIPIDKFVESVLPKAESVEVLVENKHEPNFFTLLSPVNAEAACMLKWHNNFSWSYAGEVTDSIKQRVKAAGGDVSGDLRCSLAWHNSDDLDIHLIQPHPNKNCSARGFKIGFDNRVDHGTGGNLDVDMNAGGPRNAVDPVENITFPKRAKMLEGTYTLYVHQYSKRNTDKVGFTAEIEFDGKVYSFGYDKVLRSKERVDVAKFKYTHADGLEIITSLPEENASRQIWGISTQTYVKCRMILNSPNHWDGQKTGNKHVFFVLEDCLHPGKARGFYNEFLTDDLREHRKVFEMLGARMKAEESDRQLSGVGFSVTQRNSVFCKVQGAFNRTVKVTF